MSVEEKEDVKVQLSKHLNKNDHFILKKKNTKQLFVYIYARIYHTHTHT